MKKANPKKHKRIRVAVVGSDSVTKEQAAKAAAYILPRLIRRYEITAVASVKEDVVGKAFRQQAKRMGIDLITRSAKNHEGQSDALELATAGLIWDAKRFLVILGKGCIEGCAKYAMEMLARNEKYRKAKILELEE